MIAEFLVALIESIDGPEEGDRVRDMDSDGNAQAAANIPHGIKTRVIYRDELPGSNVLPQIEPERLQNLQAACAIAMSFFDCLGLNLRIASLQQPLIARLSEGVKAAGMGCVVAANVFADADPVAAGEIHHG